MTVKRKKGLIAVIAVVVFLVLARRWHPVGIYSKR